MQSGINPQSGIYTGFTGLGDLAYIGLNSNSDPWKRLDVHEYKLEKGTHSNLTIQSFYDQFGIGSFYRTVLFECDSVYLNTLEKAFIHYGNTNQKFNPEGWNLTAGGEGARAYSISYSFVQSGILYSGQDILPFLISGQMDPRGFIEVLDGRRKDYEGFILY